GMQVMVIELAQPTVIRRAVAFATAVFEGAVEIEGVVGRRVDSVDQAARVLQEGEIPVVVDPWGQTISQWHPDVVVDAILAKRNVGTSIKDAPTVVALGPGFVAGVDAHAVVETRRGHYLGRVLLEGSAAPDTGIPGEVMGYTVERVLRAPRSGSLLGSMQIGDQVRAGDVVAQVADEPLVARIDGVLRGLLADGLSVKEGMKVGDVDPRGIRDHCFTISDKALTIGGGVLEAILLLQRGQSA
ncbi:MAG TPA: selenium-dependent molybdenum cofactor biosynthesis protein YqeB, partial [Anaerolineae bacterium]|nr:selenium-dependent molybdenum cofactor biosynthesis protein YqeB [Anaerolineae bacterium]